MSGDRVYEEPVLYPTNWITLKVTDGGCLVESSLGQTLLL